MRTLSFLATNDDGIDSPLLGTLVAALQTHGRVVVAAPSGERSWISKAISRQNARMRVEKHPAHFNCPAWSIDGTPADCVNLALGHLVDEPIDVVVSGINMGSNAGLPLIMASGTVGGALEGALAGLHAIATSIRLGRADFERLKNEHGALPSHVAATVVEIARRSAELAECLGRSRKTKHPVVHNLNFPPETTHDTPLERTVPAVMTAGPLFAPTDEPGFYGFSFTVGEAMAVDLLTDRACIDTNRASYSILDFGKLGVSTGVAKTSSTDAP